MTLHILYSEKLVLVYSGRRGSQTHTYIEVVSTFVTNQKGKKSLNNNGPFLYLTSYGNPFPKWQAALSPLVHHASYDRLDSDT